MPGRKKHPRKEIELAIQYAESKGWLYKKSVNSAHAWGRLLCPLHTPEGCALSIWSTPRNVRIHADQIKRRIDRCLHVIEVFYETESI
ncbi:MAG: hypothetical protein P1U40_12620 [Coxiellaceae bacterium]|nr:hypothetical protein [Coxiellaceae bacterium]